MTSLHGNSFNITVPLCGETPNHHGLHSQRTSNGVSFHASMMKLLKKQSKSVDDMRRHVLGNVKQKRDKVVNICFLCQTYIILSVKARACYSRLMSCHATHKLVSAAPLPYIHISYLVTSVTRETLTSICQKYLRMWPYSTANPYIFEDNN